jgi:ABC-type microcin C transport system permease subunit YejB
MLAIILRRLGQAILVMLVVALIAFALFRFVGDPINQMVGIETSVEERCASSSASTIRCGCSSPASCGRPRRSTSAPRISSSSRSPT